MVAANSASVSVGVSLSTAAGAKASHGTGCARAWATSAAMRSRSRSLMMSTPMMSLADDGAGARVNAINARIERHVHERQLRHGAGAGAALDALDVRAYQREADAVGVGVEHAAHLAVVHHLDDLPAVRLLHHPECHHSFTSTSVGRRVRIPVINSAPRVRAMTTSICGNTGKLCAMRTLTTSNASGLPGRNADITATSVASAVIVLSTSSSSSMGTRARKRRSEIGMGSPAIGFDAVMLRARRPADRAGEPLGHDAAALAQHGDADAVAVGVADRAALARAHGRQRFGPGARHRHADSEAGRDHGEIESKPSPCRVHRFTTPATSSSTSKSSMRPALAHQGAGALRSLKIDPHTSTLPSGVR